MKNKKLLLPLSYIFVIILTFWAAASMGKRGAFSTAEDLIFLPSKSFYVSSTKNKSNRYVSFSGPPLVVPRKSILIDPVKEILDSITQKEK